MYMYISRNNNNNNVIGSLHNLSRVVFQKINSCFCFTVFLQCVLFVCVFCCLLFFLLALLLFLGGPGRHTSSGCSYSPTLRVISVDSAPSPGDESQGNPFILSPASVLAAAFLTQPPNSWHFWWFTFCTCVTLTDQGPPFWGGGFKAFAPLGQHPCTAWLHRLEFPCSLGGVCTQFPEFSAVSLPPFVVSHLWSPLVTSLHCTWHRKWRQPSLRCRGTWITGRTFGSRPERPMSARKPALSNLSSDPR